MTKKRRTRSHGSVSRATSAAHRSTPSQLDQPRALILVVALVAVYLLYFYSVPLPSLPAQPDGTPWYRFDFLLMLLAPGELAAALGERWFGRPATVAIFDRLPLLLAAAIIWGIAAAIGWLVLEACRLNARLERLERLGLGIGVGLNCISLYVLLVGLAGGLGNLLLFAMPAAVLLAITGRLQTRRRMQRLVQREPRNATASEKPALANGDATELVSSRWLWLAVPFVAVIVLGGMLPPVDFDVREYHLQAPKEFFQAGRITFLPHNVYANMPLGAEMLSLLAMVVLDDWWSGALAGKLAGALYAPLAALLLWTAGRRWFTQTVGVVAAIVYLGTTWVVQVSTTGLIEGASAYYLLAAWYSYWLWREVRGDGTGHFGALFIAGFLAGSGIAVKYPAALFVVAPLAAAAWWSAGLRAWKVPAVFLVASAAACGPWFAKNWMLTGNPVYPLLYGVFDGATRTPEKHAQWVRAHRPPNDEIADLGHRMLACAATSEWLSPLLFPLAVLSLAVRRDRRRVVECLLLFGWVFATWWLATHRLDRFLVPVLPIVALLAGIGATWRRDRAWSVVLKVLLVGTALWNLLFATAGPGGYNRYFVALAELQSDPERIGAWQVYLNEQVPHDGVVLSIGDAAVFDLETPVLYNTAFDDSILDELVKNRDDDDIRHALALRGITHVYVHWGEIARYRSPGNYGYTDFVQPEVFERLVAAGILERPVNEFAEQGVLIYPVRSSADAAETGR